MFFFHPHWPVFYEDNHLLVLYKPAGLITQRDRKDKPNLGDLAKQWLKERYNKPGRVFAGIVHRLDAPVAGVMVLARTSKAAGRLSDQFRQGIVEKQYLAVVNGRPPVPADRLTHRLVRDGRHSRVADPTSPQGQPAALSYRLLETQSATSLLAITLETGRRHQIRLQLSAIGCPIVGDRHYGAGQTLADGCIALMAHRLAFIHPTRQERMQFETLPPDGWPWKSDAEVKRPLWSIESYQKNGLVLPDCIGK